MGPPCRHVALTPDLRSRVVGRGWHCYSEIRVTEVGILRSVCHLHVPDEDSGTEAQGLYAASLSQSPKPDPLRLSQVCCTGWAWGTDGRVRPETLGLPSEVWAVVGRCWETRQRPLGVGKGAEADRAFHL